MITEDFGNIRCTICSQKLEYYFFDEDSYYACYSDCNDTHLIISKNYLTYFYEYSGNKPYKWLHITDSGALKILECNYDEFSIWEELIQIDAPPGYFYNMIEIIDNRINVDNLLNQVKKISILK